jgi:diacylglycerol kinase (ATP)
MIYQNRIKNMPQQAFRFLFIINRGSGRKKNTDWEGVIKDYFTNLPHSLHFFSLPTENAVSKLRKTLEEVAPQRVVAVGGDGTVSFAAREVMGSALLFGILPAGSANGMAKELGIPDTPQQALDIILKGEARSVDVIGLNGSHICLHLSDIGLNAQLVKYFQKGGTRGLIGYAFALLKVLYRKQRIKVVVQTRDQLVERTALMVLIANASRYGTGATINPEGDICDGFFEIVIVSKIGMNEIFRMFLHFRRFDPKSIEVLSARAANLETARKAHFQVDGEYIGKVDRVVAKVLPEKLLMIVPKGS